MTALGLLGQHGHGAEAVRILSQLLTGNDLENESHMEAITAVSALGHHGHRAEAVRVLGQVVGSDSSWYFVQAGYEALFTFGNDAAPAIAAGLKGDDRKKNVVLRAIVEHFPESTEKEQTTALAEQTVRLLLPLLREKSPAGDGEEQALKRENRVWVAVALDRIFWVGAPDELAETALPILMKAARSDDDAIVSECISAIGHLGKQRRSGRSAADRFSRDGRKTPER